MKSLVVRMLLVLPVLLGVAWSRDVKELQFSRPGGHSLTLDAWLPDDGQRRGAVILVHGGGWEAGDKRTYIRPWFETLTAAGIPWFTINYRVAPQYPHPAAVEDIEAAVRWVRRHANEYNVDPSRLVLMGESAGGHLAALAALRGKVEVAGLVSFYGIHDVRQWKAESGGLPRNISLYLPNATDSMLMEASPVTYIHRGQPPMLLVHGRADTGVPWQQSERFCTAARQVGARCAIQIIEGAPHGVENWEKEARFQVWKRGTVEWLKRLVG
jgi:acetyl esterase